MSDMATLIQILQGMNKPMTMQPMKQFDWQALGQQQLGPDGKPVEAPQGSGILGKLKIGRAHV